MKKIILIFVVFLFANTISAQDISLARAEKVSGKYVFMNSEPIEEYETVFFVDIKFVWSNKQLNTPDKVASMIMKKALKISKKKNLEFDAIMINGRQAQDVAIKFKK
ncbi:MAG: hypothetical protein H8E84_01325 [Flavobacteriales bacterium]|nr:hypothetical protein [Flavobacteriales bacterium]